ncbi:hypothetical protein GCM10009867_02350 [Pedococcus aerophilus]|uniref:Uncharacterized protein n=1 Tax=Pedococcus aerophilus TaxID=436356 RepID=A0ABN3UD64_9MICO
MSQNTAAGSPDPGVAGGVLVEDMGGRAPRGRWGGWTARPTIRSLSRAAGPWTVGWAEEVARRHRAGAGEEEQ